MHACVFFNAAAAALCTRRGVASPRAPAANLVCTQAPAASLLGTHAPLPPCLPPRSNATNDLESVAPLQCAEGYRAADEEEIEGKVRSPLNLTVH